MSGARDVELYLYENLDGRTYPCLVRDPFTWIADLNGNSPIRRDDLTGVLRWTCGRCRKDCSAAMTSSKPLQFATPDEHYCAPRGLRAKLAAVWAGTGTDPRAFIPELPPIPAPAPA